MPELGVLLSFLELLHGCSDGVMSAPSGLCRAGFFLSGIADCGGIVASFPLGTGLISLLVWFRHVRPVRENLKIPMI